MDARHVRDFGIGTYIRGLLQGLAEIADSEFTNALERRK